MIVPVDFCCCHILAYSRWNMLVSIYMIIFIRVCRYVLYDDFRCQ